MGSTDALRNVHQEQAEQANGRVALVNPLAPDEGRRVTLEEYWERWYEHPYPDIDVSYEWNNGILEAKPMPNAPQLDLGNWFLALLLQYINTHGIAKVDQYGDRLSSEDDRLRGAVRDAPSGAQAGHRDHP